MQSRTSFFYSVDPNREWIRLKKDPYHQIEFLTTIHFLKKYLPKKGIILDAGGGPGRYTIELVKLGYTVILLDPVSELLKVAKDKIKKSKMENKITIVEGSITNLSQFQDQTFDAVLCLGAPLAHILKKKERKKAIRQLSRVAKIKAPVCVSTLNRTGSLFGKLIKYPKKIAENKKLFGRIWNNGNYKSEYDFTDCYYYTPKELEEDLELAKLEVLETVALEGLATWQETRINSLFKHKKSWELFWKIHLETCCKKELLLAAHHILMICRKY